MRFKVQSYEQKKSRLRRWHRWFAWRPVRLSEFPDQVVWLSTVERKIYIDSDEFGVCYDRFYREVGSSFN